MREKGMLPIELQNEVWTLKWSSGFEALSDLRMPVMEAFFLV